MSQVTEVKALRLYEGMFLLSQQTASAGLNEAINAVSQILERAEAEVLCISKWDERKLSHPIRGQKRGLYVYALFRAAGVRIANIERDCNLGDDVTRVLITAADHMGETEIELAQQAAARTADEAVLTAEPAVTAEASDQDDNILGTVNESESVED
ncbi:MAG: 30S ribosomal protein S6 [Phycisphaeraceae bacterium]|nr:30S ribosomal protein S6 [Phycisphaeraceae bacterium]